VLAGDLICSEAWRKSRRRQASVNGDKVSNAFCCRTADTSNISLNEKMMNVQSIFHTVGTEVREQEGLRKPGYINKGERVVVFDHVLPFCITC